jgi:hypothetical protein
MSYEALSVPSTHPYAEAIALANREMEFGHAAIRDANEGRARVCGRRAVGAFVQAIAPRLGTDFGSHAMANLRTIAGDISFPNEMRLAAERLLGGARSIIAGDAYSTDPLADALLIINYFLSRAS